MLAFLLRVIAALKRGRRAPADETKPATRTPPPDLASRIVRAMETRGHIIDRGPGQINIVYLEGADANGAPNEDAPNAFNDRRLVVRFDGGAPNIVGNWQATTEPGRR